MNERSIQEWLTKRLSEFGDTLQADLSVMLATARAEHAAAIANAKKLDADLQTEGNARRAAEEDARQVRLKFDPEIKAQEAAKLRERRDQLLAEAESISKAITAADQEKVANG